jgi:hypothetical protein
MEESADINPREICNPNRRKGTSSYFQLAHYSHRRRKPERYNRLIVTACMPMVQNRKFFRGFLHVEANQGQASHFNHIDQRLCIASCEDPVLEMTE